MNIININPGKQTYDFDCGAQSLHSVLSFYGENVYEGDLIKELKTDKDGTPFRNIIKAAKKRNYKVWAVKNTTCSKIKEFLDKNIPIIVVLQAWAEKRMTDEEWKNDTEDGHYAIVVGMEDGLVVFEDPYSSRRTWLKEEEFLYRWHDIDLRTGEKFNRSAIAIYGKKPNNKNIEHMD